MAVGDGDDGPVYEVSGVKMSAVEGNIRYPDRLDLVLFELNEESTVAGVFTQNAFCAAPVVISKRHLSTASPSYFLVNTGNANAGTGHQGELDALHCCKILADNLKVEVSSILPFSTGVIGELLPVDKIGKAIPNAICQLNSGNWLDAAKGILTTDTRPKIASSQLSAADSTLTITGVAKGAGMIKPNMATMLAFVFTDAKIEKNYLNALLKKFVDQSFNRITVDGDTSTNDCCMLVATGKSGVEVTPDSLESKEFETELASVFRNLAVGLIKDAEGVSKFITLIVKNGADSSECLQVAYCVAESPLVKTAMFASDPNWGRILAAVGRAGISDLDIDLISIFLGNVCIVSGGGVDSSYTEAAGQHEMNEQEITITIDLARGGFTETVWTSDLSTEYVRINADYRS